MSKPKKTVVAVQGTAIVVLNQNNQDYLALTDLARYRNSQEPLAVINHWMRGRSTIEFLGLWERLSNPDFKPLEFERFRSEAGSTCARSRAGRPSRSSSAEAPYSIWKR
jgi:KilA-N domain